MYPLNVLRHELGQVEACEAGAAGALVVYIAHVSHRGLQFLFLLFKQRHCPSRLADAAANFGDGVAELVGTDHGGGACAECDKLCAGQGCGLNQVVRVVLACARNSVGKHEAALSVGVEHLGGLATVVGDHIARAGCVARRHVFSHRQPRIDSHRQLQLCCGNDRTQLRGRTAHVRNHVFHIRGRLQGDTAGIKRDALANQGDVLVAATVVRHVHQLRAVLGTLANCDDAAEALLGQLVARDDLNCQVNLVLPLFGEVLDNAGVGLRVEERGRGVDQVTGEIHGIGHGNRAVKLILVSANHSHGGRGVVVLRLEACVLVAAQKQTLNHGLGAKLTGCGGFLDIAKRAGCNTVGAAYRLIIDVVGVAEAGGEVHGAVDKQAKRLASATLGAESGQCVEQAFRCKRRHRKLKAIIAVGNRDDACSSSRGSVSSAKRHGRAAGAEIVQLHRSKVRSCLRSNSALPKPTIP